MNTRRFALVLGLALCWLPGAVPTHAAEVIDRIVAVVNGHVILQSQLEDDLCYEAFVEGRPLDSLADQDRRSALGHLVDQELLRQQTQTGELPQPPAEQVQKRLQEIRAVHPEAASDSGWHSTLATYGFDERRLAARVAFELSVLREVDLRLRPTIQIENESIDSYYRNVFLEELRKAGLPPVPLPEVSGRIREILTQEKINEAFTTWLQSLRKDSKIRTLLPLDNQSAAGGATQ